MSVWWKKDTDVVKQRERKVQKTMSGKESTDHQLRRETQMAEEGRQSLAAGIRASCRKTWWWRIRHLDLKATGNKLRHWLWLEHT